MGGGRGAEREASGEEIEGAPATGRWQYPLGGPVHRKRALQRASVAGLSFGIADDVLHVRAVHVREVMGTGFPEHSCGLPDNRAA